MADSDNVDISLVQPSTRRKETIPQMTRDEFAHSLIQRSRNPRSSLARIPKPTVPSIIFNKLSDRQRSDDHEPSKHRKEEDQEDRIVQFALGGESSGSGGRVGFPRKVLVVWVVVSVGWGRVLRFGVRSGGLHFRRRGGVALVVVVVLVVSLRRRSVLRLLTSTTAVRVVHRVRRTVVIVVAPVIVPSILISSLRLRLTLSKGLLTSVEFLS
jgi:hypothetical protein